MFGNKKLKERLYSLELKLANIDMVLGGVKEEADWFGCGVRSGVIQELKDMIFALANHLKVDLSYKPAQRSGVVAVTKIVNSRKPKKTKKKA